MPWKECHVMDERLRFVARLVEGEKMAPLCAEFGISRKTGYKIFDRYKDCGLTALSDRSDPEALRATMRAYYGQMRTILERHGGTVEKFVGDAVMAVFGVPVAHEDDALRAVRAVWEMRDAVRGLGLQARIGVNTGEVVAGEGDTLVTGDAVNVAARLEENASPGEVLIGEQTQRLVRGAVDAEPVRVRARGKGTPNPTIAVDRMNPPAMANAPCARLMKPIRPIVTDRPTEMTYRIMP